MSSVASSLWTKLLLVFAASSHAFPDPVVLTDFHGIVAEESDDGAIVLAKLRKTDKYDAIAVSRDQILGTSGIPKGLWRGVAFKLRVGGRPFSCGLAASPGAELAAKIEPGDADIHFAAKIDEVGNFIVSEMGQTKGYFGTTLPGDSVMVALNSEGKMEYLVNGQVRYTSRQVPTASLFVKVAANGHGAFLENLRWIAESSSLTSESVESWAYENVKLLKDNWRLEAENVKLQALVAELKHQLKTRVQGEQISVAHNETI